MANFPTSCQHLLLQVSEWLRWLGMAAKVPKCQCISFQASDALLKDLQLHLNGVSIPFTLESMCFLHRNIHVRFITSSKNTIPSKFNSMMKAVDRTPTTRRQKLLFSGAVCSRLTWPLLIQKLSTTWVEKQLDSITIHYLKWWAGLSKSTNTAILYLPRSLGGLNLPLLSTFHQKLQVSCQCQLLTSRDWCVHFLADHSVQAELLSVSKSFKPAVSARDVLAR